ncbi:MULTISPECIES: hydantoinase/oxoprolinase family protein [Cupriavidus]
MKHISIGVDIGGTFTDIVALDYQSGRIHAKKVLTAYADPTQPVMDGIAALLEENGFRAAQVGRFVHATTLFTNALIEGKGARTGLLATAGFGDAIEIGRERRYDLYDVHIDGPQSLVPRHLRAEIAARIDAAGIEVTPPDRGETLEAVGKLVAQGVDSLAVCLLHAYANPRHEEQVAAWITEVYGGISVCISSAIAPEIREYDRVCTTVANACVQPLARSYLDRLEHRVKALGIDCGVLMMLSNGGLSAVAEARRKPIDLLESGPAAGAISAAWSGRRNDRTSLLAFDMGGTTAKLCLVQDARPAVAYGFEAARRKRFAEGSGIPVKITTVDLIEIGAGGGSIARADSMKLLKVGPESAASEPGPACFSRGGTQPTVTDANVVLGYLDPESFAGGAIPIDAGKAGAALQALGARIGMDGAAIAQGIHDIVAENMAGAARVHIAERGHDPRKFDMVCTGGGGPLHGYAVARKVGIGTLIVPPAAGVASAIGLLVAPARADRSRTAIFQPSAGDLADLESSFGKLADEARGCLDALQDGFGAIALKRYADGRFVGQGFTLTVQLPDGPYAGPGVDAEPVRAALLAAFNSAYSEKFGRTPPNVPVELVSLRVSALAHPSEAFVPAALRQSGQPAAKRSRPVFFEEAGGFVDTAIYARDELAVNAVLPGPLLVVDADSTLVVGPGGTLVQSETGNLIVNVH